MQPTPRPCKGFVRIRFSSYSHRISATIEVSHIRCALVNTSGRNNRHSRGNISGHVSAQSARAREARAPSELADRHSVVCLLFSSPLFSLHSYSLPASLQGASLDTVPWHVFSYSHSPGGARPREHGLAINGGHLYKRAENRVLMSKWGLHFVYNLRGHGSN